MREVQSAKFKAQNSMLIVNNVALEVDDAGLNGVVSNADTNTISGKLPSLY